MTTRMTVKIEPDSKREIKAYTHRLSIDMSAWVRLAVGAA